MAVAWLMSILLFLAAPNIASSSSPSSSSANEIISVAPPLEGASASSWQTCSSHASCADCYAASHTCHWCGGSCHVKGSVRGGCVRGESCDADDHTADDAKACADHATCSDCTSSTWGCHWCASDETCHAVGSVHGCAAGANCYSIDRCQRLEPERLDGGGTFSRASFRGVGPVAKGVLITVMALVLCCSTLCFGGATFLKCAVDDLVGEPVEIVEDGMLVGGAGAQQGQQYEMVREDEEGPEAPLLEKNETEPSHDAERMTRSESGYIGEVNAAAVDGSNPYNNRNSQLIRSTEEGEAASVARSRLSLSSNRATPRGSSIKRMYCACQSCYFLTLVTTIYLFVVGMSYAPREPQYNVCTNELAWKSIVEGMASLKMSASFDLLISVYNPNRFEVDLSNGSGQFHHDGEYVGSFEIPEGTISEQAISDIVVKVTFTPDKWAALSLTSEYYRGNLKFVVGGHAHVKIPGLGNYSFEAKFDDIHVNVNDPSMDDTHLCACPGWKRPIDLI